MPIPTPKTSDHISLSTIAIIIYISLLTIGTCLFMIHCYKLLIKFLFQPTLPKPPTLATTSSQAVSIPLPTADTLLRPRSQPAADLLSHDALRRLSWLEASSKNHIVLNIERARPGEPIVAFEQDLPRYSLIQQSSLSRVSLDNHNGVSPR